MEDSRLDSHYRPEHFWHLARGGRVTVLGFGSLVSEASARESFELANFRLGTAAGVQRLFGRADWINIDWGDARVATGEVASLAMAVTGDTSARCRVALMDVTAEEGLEGFLHRESTYRIIEVPFRDDLGKEGIALACGECADKDVVRLWGPDVWYLRHCTGRISYLSEDVPQEPMPLVPPCGGAPGDASAWLELTPGSDEEDYVYELPQGPWIYPAPGYLRMVYRAHVKAGILDNFLDTTLLMDRGTTLRSYLSGNPLLDELSDIEDSLIEA